jgi:Delta14-sterol reductase
MVALWGPLAVYTVVLVLHLALPGRWVDGYLIDPATERPLRYRLNGLRVLFVTLALYAGACRLGWMPWDWFYLHRWEMAAGACGLGVLFTLWIVLPAPSNRGMPWDLYLGRIANPRWGGGRLDAKMFLYLVGAVMLELNIVSFTAYHIATHSADPSAGLILHALLFSFFVVEYLNFEEVHLYTYDFMAERVGGKLGWGCLVFYPFFYPVGLWAVADRPDPHTPIPLLALYALTFFAGWTLARGANLQKFWFKRDPTAKAFGVLEPRAISGGGKQVLAGGFWGLSRHINYLGEIGMATGLTLCLGYPLAFAPWLYPLYYVVLLVPRQIDDDRRCAEKYGPLWEEYRRRVPSRIIPGIY